MKKHFFLPRYQLLTSVLFLLLTVCFQTVSEESLLNSSSLPAEIRTSSEVISSKKIALTFDDGPYPELSERLLEILAKEKINATFFIVGEMGARSPGLLQLFDSQGHEVAGHTYTHPNLTRISLTRIKEELEKTRVLIREFTGKDTYLFRPPGGNYNENLKNICSSLGYQPIFWTILPQDHLDIPVEEIYQRVVKNVHPDGIIILHSGKENTLNALPKIIQTLKKENYRFVTVSELNREKVDDFAGKNLSH